MRRPIGISFSETILSIAALVAAANALRYVVLGPDGVDELSLADTLFHALGRPSDFFAGFVASQKPKYHVHAVALLLHVTGMAVALAAGSLQLIRRVRLSFPAVHRVAGLLYVPGMLLGSAFGAYLAVALPMRGSTLTVASNFAAGSLGAGFTLQATVSLVKRQFVSHGRWMLRSYGVACTLLTLYALVFVFVWAGAPTDAAYETAHLLCVPLNLVGVEAVLLRSRARLVASTVVDAPPA